MNRRTFLSLAATPLVAASSVSDPGQLRSAIRNATPGATIVLKDGVWEDIEIILDAEGTPQAPITLRAETPGKVVLSGKSRLRIGGSYLVVEGLDFRDGRDSGEIVAFRTSPARLASHCRLTECAIRNYSAESGKDNTKWLSLYGEANRVDHCYLAGKKNLGTTMVVWLLEGAAPNRHSIDHNYFGPRPKLGGNGGETIRVGTSATSMVSSRTLVESNYFEECSGEVEIISNKSCDNIYRSNTFERCEGTLTLRHGNRCLVEGNFFFGRGLRDTGGVRVIGEDHRVVSNYFDGLGGQGARAAISMMNGIPDSPLSGYFQVKGALVANNTLVDCAESIVVGIHGNPACSLPPRGCRFENNVVASKSGPLVRMADAGAEIRWQGNYFWGSAIGVDGQDPRDPGLAKNASGLWHAREGLAARFTLPRLEGAREAGPMWLRC